jgi:hypothetical protein
LRFGDDPFHRSEKLSGARRRRLLHHLIAEADHNSRGQLAQLYMSKHGQKCTGRDGLDSF